MIDEKMLGTPGHLVSGGAARLRGAENPSGHGRRAVVRRIDVFATANPDFSRSVAEHDT